VASPKPQSASRPKRQPGSAITEASTAHQPRRLTADAILRLHPVLGNAAVARMLQRRVDPIAPPEPLPHHQPLSDPNFKQVQAATLRAGQSAKQHRPATAHVRDAQVAVVPPSNDREAQAKAMQVEAMATAKAGTFDRAGFIAAVKAAVDAKSPKNLDEADSFGKSANVGEIKSQVMGQLKSGKDQTLGDVKQKTDATPDVSKVAEQTVKPLPPPTNASVPSVPGASAMPGRLPDAQLNLQGGRHETEHAMAKADVTEVQLAHSNEPEFKGALEEKKKGELYANHAPVGVRAREDQILAQAKVGAADTSTKGVAGLLAQRAKSGRDVDGSKREAKTKEEVERQRVSAQIEGIFGRTKTQTESILNGIDKTVEDTFSAGEAEARRAFEESHSKAMSDWKDKRYSGLEGAAQWIIDKVKGNPPEVKKLFVDARELYVKRMEVVVGRVADVIGKGLTDARTSIAQGRAEVKNFVAQQRGNTAKYASQAAGAIESQFAILGDSVDQKQSALVDDLASRYSEARDEVDSRVEALQEEGKGLWDQAKAAVMGVIDTILKLKDMLTNVLARASSAVTRIIKDPIGFLGNLVGAVKSGIDRFANKAAEHVSRGLKEWLFGELAEAGIELPDTFDAAGIFQLVMSVVGLTWKSIRTMIVKRVGEPVMAKLESTVDFVKVLINEGPAGLWKMLSNKIGDLKTMVMDQIQDFVMTKVIMSGITWLIGFLNPAAAFIKACKAIYDLVNFFIEKGSAIKGVIDSVLDSVEEVLSGGVSKVGSMIENALAKAVPVLIGLFASLLGLGGIGDKVKKILETVRKPVTKAVDFVVGKAVSIGKRMLKRARKSRLGVAFRKGKAKVNLAIRQGKKWVKAKVAGGKKWLGDKARKVGEALGIIKKPFNVGPEHHNLFLDMRSRQIIMASTPAPLEQKIKTHLERRKRTATPEEFVKIQDQAKHVLNMAKSVKETAKGKSKATSSKAMDALTATITDFLIKNMTGKTVAGTKEIEGAPEGLGNIARHGSNQGNGDVLRSEHVIPRAMLNVLLHLHGLEPIGAGSPEYNHLHTIKTYKTAATSVKDHSDNTLHTQMKQVATETVKFDTNSGYRKNLRGFVRDRAKGTWKKVREGMTRAQLREKQAEWYKQREDGKSKSREAKEKLIRNFWAHLNGRAHLAVIAVQQDHKNHPERVHKEPLPSEDKIRYAAALEAEDFIRIVADRTK
jgi:hypothetical protein